MGEFSVEASSCNDKDQTEQKSQTPMQETNDALKECGFGRFQIRLLCTAFFGTNAIMSLTNVVPFILPSAECDLHMDLFNKGVLTATPFIGTLLTSALGGFLTDTFGRKSILVGSYGLMAIFNLISALSQTFSMMIFAKFFEGVLMGSAYGTTTIFTSEFCHNGDRDRMMLFQSSFYAVNQIAIASLAWGVIYMTDWRYTFFDGYIVLNQWHFFLLFIPILSAVACLLYSLLPESPKYLVSQGRYDEARDALIFMYRENARKPKENFKFRELWKEKETKMKSERPQSQSTKSPLAHKLTTGLRNSKPLFQSPYGHSLLLLCTMSFIIMALFNIIRMWYPQLSTIMEHYRKDDNEQLCDMLDSYDSVMKARNVNATVDAAKICVPASSGNETYIGAIILGTATLIPYMLSGFLVKYVSKKWLLVICSLICIGATLGLRWSSSKVVVVALFATDIAIAQVMLSLLQTINVEIFPTTIRTLAIGMIMTVGRVGSLVGNLTFPVLLSLGCVVPFYTLAALMACVTLMAIAHPNTKVISN